MRRYFTQFFSALALTLCICTISNAQTTIKGTIKDGDTGELLIGATVLITESSEGITTDYNGEFLLETAQNPPFEITISYIGYEDQTRTVNTKDENLDILLVTSSVVINAVEIKGQRISDKQKAAPQTVESMDLLAIKSTPAASFYDGLGSLKGVDLTAASFGFKVINTRGFNSTSPVRSLQIIDGVDNQAPGLNFSLGNFLGASELDVNKVDLIVGANSALYGPNAFNGVISMTTKDPFFTKGLSANVKVGNRNMASVALRYADVVNNKNGLPFLGYKINFFHLRADDWEADNEDAVYESESPFGNPGGWDKVNTYGDEYDVINDFSTSTPWTYPGLGVFHRTGYREVDLVDYDTRNTKANVALHFRLDPEAKYNSPELILSSSFGSGTTVYQGDNRFSLKNITFFQNRIELRKRDKYFIRAYMTNENAGDSYDPYFTALKLQDRAKSEEFWSKDYVRYWEDNIRDQMFELGYPQLDFSTIPATFDYDAADAWIANNQDLLTGWHQEAAGIANIANPTFSETTDFLVPGTPAYNQAFNEITSAKNNSTENGTKFSDRSALYHIQGEYTFTTDFLDKIIVGGSSRLYAPNSEGTIFIDTISIDSAGNETQEKIRNFEYGLYTGIEKNLFSKRLKVNATVRMDKNQNFDYLFTPAASLVYTPSKNNYLRVSFSSAIRNPTLSDQYLFLNVGPAILAGNLEGRDSLVTLESFDDFRQDLDLDTLRYFDIAPIKPERVKTFELGYRTTLFEKIYVDAGYYYSIYNDFIGYNLGLDIEFDPDSEIALPTDIQAYRFAANSVNEVTTQGLSIGVNYYFAKYFQFAGNYSWNKLNSDIDDPIIPAFNTPEHKYNLGISARGIESPIGDIGFNVNYKWIEGFLFEGSPQFTGFIDSYSLLDAQVNTYVKKWNTTFKLGGTNLMNNLVSQTYGGPRIGRVVYLSMLYEFKKD